MTPLPNGMAAVEDRLRGRRLGFEDRPVGEIAVPLDQRRNRPAPRDHDLEEFPNGIRDRTIMAVDQQQVALVIGLFGMAGEMNLADTCERKVGQIVQRRETVIGSGHEDIVDVEQQAASGTPRHAADEIRLAHRGLGKRDIGRRILEQHRPADRFLNLGDVVADPKERRFGVGQRQEIVEIGGLMRRPGEMLGDQRRLVAIDEMLETRQMCPVERPLAADRQAHAVQRDGIVASHGFEGAMRRSARAHVVLGMNFEEATPLALGANRSQMFVLEAGPGEAADRQRRKAEGNGRTRRRFGRCFHVVPPLSATRLPCCSTDQTGLSEPVLPFGSWMLAQVPPCTNFHALPWKSVVEVPWHVVPGPAAQSFWPFSATPKHFSLWAAIAASPSALVSGPAAAMVASAVVTAPARTNELTTFFAEFFTDMGISPLEVCIATWASAHRLIRPSRGRRYG